MRRQNMWSDIWNSLHSGQGSTYSNANGIQLGPSSNGKDLGLGLGHQIGALQGTGYDTMWTDGTNINAGLGTPGWSNGVGLTALGVPVFNMGRVAQLDWQQGVVGVGTNIGAGAVIPNIYSDGFKVDYGGATDGIKQMLSGIGQAGQARIVTG